MSERIFPKMKDQVMFLSALAQLKVGESKAPLSQKAPAAQPMIICQVRFPPTVLTALTNKDAALKSHAKNRIKTMLIQALFDHLSQDTMYPSHIQYVDLLKSVLLNFPFLKESYGSGYQTDAMDAGEDERKVLKEFPCFSIPILLCEEASALLKVDDVDKLVIRGFNKLSSQLVSMAPKSNLKSLCLQSVDESNTDAERKGQLVNAAILLLPSVFKENSSQLFAIDKEPLSPTPTIVLSSSDGKPLSDSTEVFIAVDGQKMMVDNEDADISLAMGVVLALYHVFDLAYPCQLKKTFSFLEAFILKLDKRVPVAVQRVANALDIS
ncbi:hypothetical protein VZT92_021259 [Zoarces viviparus]|uniref:Uncharacterized protein n=1 Tax=Zoarces viviparus TaxID=48416 RepID=A0AAW1EG08_ZOAVI